MWNSDDFARNFHALACLLRPLVIRPIMLTIYECSRHFPVGCTVVSYREVGIDHKAIHITYIVPLHLVFHICFHKIQDLRYSTLCVFKIRTNTHY